MPAPSPASSAAKDFWRWLKGILTVIGGIWVICIIAGFFGSIMMNCGRVVYIPVPSRAEPAWGNVPHGPPVIFDGPSGQGRVIGIPMLPPVQVTPYDVIEAHEYGIRRRRGGYLPPVCVPRQYPQSRMY